MPNRTKRPPIEQLNQVEIPKIELLKLDNQIPVYLINQGTQEVLKLEIVFEAGRPFEKKPLVSRVTAALLKEGSKKYGSAQLAEIMDFYGSSLKVPVDMDHSSIILYTLQKHFANVLPVLYNIITQPKFDSAELKDFVNRQCHRMEVDLSKTDVIAYRSITEHIFGPNHPYGYNSTPDLYHQLNREDLLSHFNNTFHAGTCKIFLSGKIGKQEVDLLKKTFAGMPNKGEITAITMEKQVPTSKKIEIPQPQAIQTALRIGRPLFHRSHEDYPAIFLLNTLLGGYFGSRLMTNIRENKGFTYNISSSVDCMRFDGSWIISSEIGNDFVEETRVEIYKEFEVLRNTLIEEQELSMLKNYIMGVLLGMLDGPFNISELVKGLVVSNCPLPTFENIAQTVKNMTPKDIQKLAQKYLQAEDFVEVKVGPI